MLQSLAVPTSGTASFDASSLAEGNVQIAASIQNAVGSASLLATKTVVKDTQLPTVSINRNIFNIILASQANYRVDGNCSEKGQSITVTLSDGNQALTPKTAAPCSSNQWAVHFNATALNEGSVEIAVSIQDVAGNTSAPVAKTVVKDIVPPAILTFSQNPLPVISLGNVSAYPLSGTCSEGERVIMVALTGPENVVVESDGTVICPTSGGSWSVQLNASSLADGTVYATAWYSDAAGNVQLIHPNAVKKDTRRPTVGISESAPDILAATQASYSLSGDL